MILLILFLLFVPFLIGQPICKMLNRGGKEVVDIYVCGVMTMFVISGVLHLFVMLTNNSFSYYLKMYPIIVFTMAIIGAVLIVFDVKKNKAENSVKPRITGFGSAWLKNGELLMFGVLNLVVMLLCVTRIVTGEPDVTGDFTLETIRTTLQTDSIYQYNSFTGKLIEEGMPIRQQILTLPFFQLFLSDFFCVEIKTVLYKIFPCFVFFWGVLVYSRLAEILFAKQKERQLLFVFIVNFMMLVGDYARMTPAALVIHQGFTGYAICAHVIIPFAICLSMNRKWLMACVCVAAEMFLIWTTYGLGYSVLVIILFALIEIVGMVIGKKKKV